MYHDNDTLSQYKSFENCQSAYMLIYERKHKFPLKTVIQEKDANEIIVKVQNNETDTGITNIVSFKEEEYLPIHRQHDFFVLDPLTNSSKYYEAQVKMTETLFHDISKNEFYTYKPYYTENKLIPKEYFLEVLEDNLTFQKQKTTSDESYVKFMNSITKTLSSTLNEVSISKVEEAKDISKTLLNFMMSSLSSNDKKDMLTTVLEKLIIIITNYPLQVCKDIVDTLLSKTDFVKECLINEEESVVLAYSRLLYSLTKEFYSLGRDKIKEANLKPQYGDDHADYCVKLCDFVVSLYPRIGRSYFSSIAPLHNYLKSVAELGDEMLEYFVDKGIICILVAYLIGRDSPYYLEYTPALDSHNEYNRGYATHSDDLVELIITVYKRSNEFSNAVIAVASEGKEDKNSESLIPPETKVLNIIFSFNNVYIFYYYNTIRSSIFLIKTLIV